MADERVQERGARLGEAAETMADERVQERGARLGEAAPTVEEAELLAAIEAAPDDDGPRLVLADWLQQRGDPWGEMIVLSCALAQRHDNDDETNAMFERFDELRKTRFPDPRLSCTFERGFCTKLESSELALATGSEFALVRDAALERATAASLRALADWPQLARITTLRMEAEHDDAGLGRDVPPIVAGAHALRTLELMRMDVLRPELEVMFALPHAGELRSLSIMANEPLSDALAGVAWPALAELDLGACSLHGPDIADLLEGDALLDLERLELSYNPIDDRGANAIAMRPFTRLERLELQGTDVAAGGVEALARSDYLRGLRRFAIGGGFETDIDDALPMLATAFPELLVLTVESRSITPHLAAIARPLHELSLRLDAVDPGVLAALLLNPALRTLHALELQLEADDLGDAVAEVIASVDLPQLRWLRLYDCRISARGARALAGAHHLPVDLNLIIFGRNPELGDPAELKARFPNADV
jgi:uncharacterized protein (TIGR02996 family)